MAGKFGPGSAWLFVDGYDLRLMKLKGASFKIEALTEETDGLGDNFVDNTPTGKSRVTVAQTGGLFDTAAGSSHAAFAAAMPSSPQATPRILCCGLAGQTVGEMFYGIEGVFSSVYEVLADLGLLTKANVEYKAVGQRDRGQILQPLADKTADWNTKTLGTSVDYTADTLQRVMPITSNSQANPTVVTTPVPHGLTTGDIILIAGVSGSSPTINGERTVTVISATTFSVPVNTSGGTGGTGGSFVRANSANGGVGYLHIKSATGFTNFVAKIRDSADDTTYADLITFDDSVTAPSAQRKTVSGVVDRYLSVDGNVTGTGSITVFVGFARN